MSIQGNINQLLTLSAGVGYLGLKRAQEHTAATKAIAEDFGIKNSEGIEADKQARLGNSILGNKRIQQGYLRQIDRKLHPYKVVSRNGIAEGTPPMETAFEMTLPNQQEMAQTYAMQHMQQNGLAKVQQKQAFVKHKKRFKGNR